MCVYLRTIRITSSLDMVLRFFLFALVCNVWAQDIVFEEETDACKLPDGGNGLCKIHSSCPEAYKDFPRVNPVICGFEGRNPIVCCPVKTGPVITDPPVNTSVPLQVSPPVIDFSCGDSYPETVIIFTGGGCPNCGPGGFPAREVTAKYSVLVGNRDESGELDWFCSGVLINRQWVLTAAHCFSYKPINIARLGEHDYNNRSDGAHPTDFDVEASVIYPEFRIPQGYHDLALIKLERPTILGPFINPVCLPWGEARSRNLANQKVSLTGWGALEFNGIGSSIIQEVNVTVFPTSVCDKSYSTLRDYELVWPRGIGETVLCAGDPQGGKDACQGDSGGPVTYLNEENKYVLAGVVSLGYGCGLKEFPGIYADIRHPPYLSWIKEVAFQ